jgi:hypothetical protein
MPKRKSVRCAIQSLGLLYITHPDFIEDTWKDAHIFQTGNMTPYSSAKVSIKGRIRISIAGESRLKALEDSAIRVHRYENNDFVGRSEVSIMESVVSTASWYNSAYAEVLQGKQATHSSDLTLLPFNSDTSNNFIMQIQTLFREKCFSLVWNQARSTYLVAFAILVVDNLSLFHGQVNQVYSSLLTESNDSVTIYSLPDIIEDFLPHLKGVSGFPLQLLVIENKESIDWIENGKIPSKNNDAYYEAIQILNYRMYLYSLELIDWQVEWINSRCKNLLERLPKDTQHTKTSREEILRQLIETSMNLDFYYISHLMAKDFILRENAEKKMTSSSSTKPLSKPIIQERISLLEGILEQLNHSLQTRVTLESILVEKQRQDQQAETERRFNILELYFAAFVLFEVVGTYLAWILDSSIFWNNIIWGLFLFSAAGLMLYGVKTFTEQGKEESEVQARIFFSCPNCNAGYWYDSSKITSENLIRCQNCAKEFVVSSREIDRSQYK